MHKTLLKMGELDTRFKDINHNLLKVGSFYGRTKIKDPVEFDYLVVLDELALMRSLLRRFVKRIQDLDTL